MGSKGCSWRIGFNVYFNFTCVSSWFCIFVNQPQKCMIYSINQFEKLERLKKCSKRKRRFQRNEIVSIWENRYLILKMNQPLLKFLLPLIKYLHPSSHRNISDFQSWLISKNPNLDDKLNENRVLNSFVWKLSTNHQLNHCCRKKLK